MKEEARVAVARDVVASLSYIEEQPDGTWHETEFLSSLTSRYTWIQHFSIAHWDPDGDGVPIEVVAFRHGLRNDEEFIDIYDLADNTEPLVENIRGKFPGFTTYTNSGNALSLFVKQDQGYPEDLDDDYLVEVDMNDGNFSESLVIPLDSPDVTFDSAD